jgi:hypothetical protein
VIVISGALVLVALVLLVIGLIGPSLGFVYASIAASLAAFAFLVVGILQRRKEEPAVAGAPGSAEEIAMAIRTPETSPVSGAELAAAGGPTGDVLVVEGRPRYHVAGCRYLTGKDAKTVAASTARAEGYSACGVCKPDDALAAASTSGEATAAAPAEAAAAAEAAAPAVAADEGVTLTKAPVRTATKAAKAPARAAKAPAKAARATKAAPAKATKSAAKATKAPAKSATKATARTAAKAAPARAAKSTTAVKAAKAPAKAAKAPAKKATKAAAKSTRSTRG